MSKQMGSNVSFEKKVTGKLTFHTHMYIRFDVNPQGLICHKTPTNQPNKYLSHGYLLNLKLDPRFHFSMMIAVTKRAPLQMELNNCLQHYLGLTR